MRAAFAVASLTFRELVARRLTWIFVAVGAVLLALSLFLGNLSFAEQLRVFLHLGFFSVSSVAVILCLTVMGGAIPREIERQTCQLSLARPIARGTWLCGKWAGLAFLVLLFCTLAGALNFATIAMLFGASSVDGLRYLGALAALLAEALAVGTVAFALSTRVRPTIAVLGAVIVWGAGNWLPDLEFFARRTGSDFFRTAADVLRAVLPPLDRLQVRTSAFVTGEAPMPESFPLFLLFCAGWVVVYLGFAVIAFRRRDLV